MKSILKITLAMLMAITGLNIATATGLDDGEGQQAIQKITKPEALNIGLYGRLQTIGFIQSLDDQFADSRRMYLYLKQARLGVEGTYEDVLFNMQLAFGPEDEVAAPSPGVGLSLLDLYADFAVTKSFRIRFGQFKVPYGREGLTNAGYLQFNDRSLQFLGSKLGRDVGVAFYAKSGDFASIVGLFTGGGRDIPIRYIPQDLGLPMITTRIGINSNLDIDLFTLKQTMNEKDGSGYAIYVNGLYTKDSRIAHSTALNVKLADKSLLLNSSWNPFIGKRPLTKGEFWQAGGDVAFRTVLKEKVALLGEAELNYSAFKNEYGSLGLTGGRAQIGVDTKPFEVALRYAFLRPDEKLAYVSSGISYPILNSDMIHEINLGVSYFLRGDRLKLTADLPITIGTPVLTEPGVGAYLLTQQPDQVSFIAAPRNSKVDRQTVVEARLQLQFLF